MAAKNGTNDSNGTNKTELIGSYGGQAIKHSRASETERIVRRREDKEDKEIPDETGLVVVVVGGEREGGRAAMACALSPAAKNVAEWLKGEVPVRRVRISPPHCRVLSTVVNLPVGARKRELGGGVAFAILALVLREIFLRVPCSLDVEFTLGLRFEFCRFCSSKARRYGDIRVAISTLFCCQLGSFLHFYIRPDF